MKFAILLFACAMLVLAPARAHATPDAKETLAITHLMQYVRESGLQFIRNSKSFNADDAANHMQKKLDYARERLSTADEFIDYVASRSSITNLPYYVVTPDGKKQEMGPWLYAELEKYRHPAKTLAPKKKK